MSEVYGANPKDAINAVKPERYLSHSNALVLDDEVPDGNRIYELLSEEQARAVDDFLEAQRAHVSLRRSHTR